MQRADGRRQEPPASEGATKIGPVEVISLQRCGCQEKTNCGQSRASLGLISSIAALVPDLHLVTAIGQRQLSYQASAQRA